MSLSSTSSISQDFRKDFECPVCLEVPKSTPIFQCDSGHIHCNICHPKLQNCPICRIKLGAQIRSLMTEKIFTQIQVKCVYEQCSKLVLIQSIQNHEEKCEFRVINCPISKICQEKIVVNSLQKHLNETHATLISKQSIQFGYRIAVPRLSKEDIEATMVVDTGLDYFVLKKKISAPNGLFTFNLKVIKSKIEDSTPLIYSLRVFNENQNQTLSIGTQGIVEDITQLKSVPILVMSYEQAQEIAVERKFILEIRVQRLGELQDEVSSEKSSSSGIEMIPNDPSCSTKKSSLFKRALQKFINRK